MASAGANWRDLAAVVLVLTIIVLVGAGARQMVAPLVAGQATGNLAFAHGLAGVCAANDATHVGGARRIPDIYVHLCDARSQEPPGRNGADPAPRRSPVRAGAWLSLLHGRFLRLAVSRQYARGGTCRHLRDLHQSSLEHGLQLFSVAEDHSARFGRGEPQFPVLRLAAFLAARGAVRHAGPDLEHDDVHVRRMVLRGRVGSDFGR